MKLKIAITLILTLLLSGCFKEDGQIRITSDVENAIIYIDGDKKGMTGDGYTTIIIEEGDHKVRIYKEKNDEWFYEGVQDVFVGANSSVKIKINTSSKPTEFRLERLAKEKKAKEERLAREKKERLAIAKKLGLSRYPIGTFYDVDTKLMWQDNKDAKTVYKNWDDSKDYCKNLTIGEYSDWRLPNCGELLTIVDPNMYTSDNRTDIQNISSFAYWSSTEESSNYYNACTAYFEGYTDSCIKSGKNHVRCVRDK